MNKHTTARKGKRIRLRLRDGRLFIEKLIEEKSTYYIFENIGKVMKSSIESFAIARTQQ